MGFWKRSRLKSRESQKYIDLGLAQKNQFSACMHTDLYTPPKLMENESRETADVFIFLRGRAFLRRNFRFFWIFFLKNILKFNISHKILMKNDEVWYPTLRYLVKPSLSYYWLDLPWQVFFSHWSHEKYGQKHHISWI